jgi:hypothetical protein
VAHQPLRNFSVAFHKPSFRAVGAHLTFDNNNMKYTQKLAACMLLLPSLLQSLRADSIPPTLKVTPEWIILTGVLDDPRLGLAPWPWTFALKKETITSIVITPNTAALQRDDDNAKKDGTKVDAGNLHAEILITTTEISSESGSPPINKVYLVRGLTISSAPAMLDQIISALKPLRYQPVSRRPNLESKDVEQAGADQPATKPADKPPVKDQPSTPTSKDAPR